MHPHPSARSTTAVHAASKNANIATCAPFAAVPTKPSGALHASPHRNEAPSATYASSLPSPNARTPILIDILEAELARHPDRSFAESIVHDLCVGCRIGFSGNRNISVISPNFSSAFAHADLVDKYLAKEVELGHTRGPFRTSPFASLRTSGIGVVPKKSGGHCLIMHLSAPDGNTV